MTRREWLERVVGAVAAATVAPLINMEDRTPAFWNQEPIKKLLPFRVTFPDGLTFAFDGHVLAEREMPDGSIRLLIAPTGPVDIQDSRKEPVGWPQPVSSAHPTVLNGENIGELLDITPPTISRCTTDDGFVYGVRRVSTMEFTINWKENS